MDMRNMNIVDQEYDIKPSIIPHFSTSSLQYKSGGTEFAGVIKSLNLEACHQHPSGAELPGPVTTTSTTQSRGLGGITTQLLLRRCEMEGYEIPAVTAQRILSPDKTHHQIDRHHFW